MCERLMHRNCCFMCRWWSSKC